MMLILLLRLAGFKVDFTANGSVALSKLRSSPPDDPVADDARLLLQQAERCRDILKTLAQKPETGDIVHARLGLAQLDYRSRLRHAA